VLSSPPTFSIVVLLVALWAASGCSSGKQHPAELGDTPPDDSGLPRDSGRGSSGADATDQSEAAADAADAQEAAPPTCPADNGCSTLQNCATKVYVSEIAQDAPATTGGAVLEGTYALTSYILYTGVVGAAGGTGTWFADTMRLTSAGGSSSGGADDAGAADGADGDAADGSADAGPGSDGLFTWEDSSRSSSSQTVGSSTGTAQFSPPDAVVFVHACPDKHRLSGTYSANGGKLIIDLSDTTGTGQLTYTKQ
jgi:hypothetical protein